MKLSTNKLLAVVGVASFLTGSLTTAFIQVLPRDLLASTEEDCILALVPEARTNAVKASIVSACQDKYAGSVRGGYLARDKLPLILLSSPKLQLTPVDVGSYNLDKVKVHNGLDSTLTSITIRHSYGPAIPGEPKEVHIDHLVKMNVPPKSTGEGYYKADHMSQKNMMVRETAIVAATHIN